MVDYYSILLRAVTAPGAGDARWRRGIYERSRQMLATRMRGLRPQPPLAEIATEEARLEAAIERIESELDMGRRASTEESRTEDPRGPKNTSATGRARKSPQRIYRRTVKPPRCRRSMMPANSRKRRLRHRDWAERH